MNDFRKHAPAAHDGLVDFMARFTSSEQFNKVFREGMGLVEETANYLDGQGRLDARRLDRHGSLAYATESMRLTTRLMQLASWLLMQRAISAGELSREAARSEKHRINLAEIGPGYALKGGEQIPSGLTTLVRRSLKLHDRILKLDAMLEVAEARRNAGHNHVARQIDELAQVFARRGGAG
jgi:regulator of CtrA degradation